MDLGLDSFWDIHAKTEAGVGVGNKKKGSKEAAVRKRARKKAGIGLSTEWANPSVDHLAFDESDGEGGEGGEGGANNENRGPGGVGGGEGRGAKEGGKGKGKRRRKRKGVGSYKSRVPKDVSDAVFGVSRHVKRPRKQASVSQYGGRRGGNPLEAEEDERNGPARKRTKPLTASTSASGAKKRQDRVREERMSREKRERLRVQAELERKLADVEYDDGYKDDAFHLMVNPKAEVVLDGARTELQVALAPEMLSFNEIERPPHKWQQATAFDMSSSFSGEIIVPPNGVKPLVSVNGSLYFYVIRGAVHFTIGDSTFTLTRGAHICVPRENAYSFHNTNPHQEARLLFVCVRDA